MNTNKLKKTSTVWVLHFMLLGIAGSCSLPKASQTPFPQSYDQIDGIQLDNGFPKKSQPWIVYSDRAKNQVNPHSSADPFTIYREATFLQPFVVLERKKGLAKLAAYSEGLINDGKLPRKKAIKVTGWLPEENLLLWNTSLKNSQTGYSAKAALVVNDTSIIKHAERFFQNDSVILFTAPDLLSKTNHKMAIGSLIYIYKQSADKKRIFIGRYPNIVSEGLAENAYGWVPSGLVKIWGDRAAIQFKKSDSLKSEIITDPHTTSGQNSAIALTPLNLQRRSGMESIYPINALSLNNATDKKTKYFTNVFNYEANKIYNVLGQPLFYTQYKEILANNKKLNIIFVLDVSDNNRLYIPLAKSLVQELQLNFMTPSYFSAIHFGAVVYKQQNCGVFPLASALTPNYKDVAQFLEEKTAQLKCPDQSIGQPLENGLLTATKMLSGRENETNILVVIGTTADQGYQTQSAISGLTRSKAKLIFFQTQSKSADAYNNFVLLAEKLMVNSAKNIAELKKEKMVNQNDLLINNNYNLTTGEEGVYSLDYPNQSMTQGIIIFPKKGDAMKAGVLKSAIDTLINQVTQDNQHVDSTLTAFFRSDIGVSNTLLYTPYNAAFPLVPQPIPKPIASALLNEDGPFLMDGVITSPASTTDDLSYGILLNEQEYEQLRFQYKNTLNATTKEKNFTKRRAIRNYVRMVSQSSLSRNKLRTRTLYQSTMNDLVRITTGFPLREMGPMNEPLKKWKTSRNIDNNIVLEYFKKHQEIYDKMGAAKGDPLIQIQHNGQVFYWLNKTYIPIVH